MAAGKEDRRVNRTRLALRSAMVALIREKGFEALTVQDILDRADVGRSTFYMHYRNKEDLLKGGVDLMRSSLRRFQRRAAAGAGEPGERLFVFSRELFAHAEEHRDVFAAMMGQHSGTVFRHHMERMLADLIREDVVAVAGRKKRDAAQIEAVVQFVTGGLMGLLASWLERMSRVSVEEMDARFRTMALPAVEAGLK